MSNTRRPGRTATASLLSMLQRRGAVRWSLLIVLCLLVYLHHSGYTESVRHSYHEKPATYLTLPPKSWLLPAMPTRIIQQPEIDLTRRDGRIMVHSSTSNATVRGRKHPIPLLMREARKKWETLLRKQSRTFAQAVAEYQRRYGRKPPKGFDRWYAWAKKNSVQLLDEYDLIEHDLHTYRAFSPRSFRYRVQYCEEYFEFGWRLVVEDGKIRREGHSKNHGRAHVMQHLIEPFAQYLPDMSMWVRGHDTAAIWRSWEESERLRQLVRERRYDNDNDGRKVSQRPKSTDVHAFVTTCPPNSAMRAPGFEFGKGSKDPEAPFRPLETSGSGSDDPVGSFVGLDLRRYMDICESPQYRHTHSGSSWTWPLPGPNCVIMTAGVHGNFGDVRTIIPEQWHDHNPTDTPWKDRKPMLVYRGQTSGPVWTKEWPWRMSHRARMHLLSHQRDGSRTILLADPEDDDIVSEREYPNSVLNPAFLDTGMVGPPVQCSKEDGTCDEMASVFDGFDDRMSLEEQDTYKFALDIDGNSWSGRFKRLMASNAMVLKATVFTEPWADWAVPWLHYVPLQVDYSDLWDILAFFRGDPETGKGAHDDLAKEIAQAGREWQEKYYRWEDLQSYQFRLLLEWARLYNDGDMDLDVDPSIEPVLE